MTIWQINHNTFETWPIGSNRRNRGCKWLVPSCFHCFFPAPSPRQVNCILEYVHRWGSTQLGASRQARKLLGNVERTRKGMLVQWSWWKHDRNVFRTWLACRRNRNTGWIHNWWWSPHLEKCTKKECSWSWSHNVRQGWWDQEKSWKRNVIKVDKGHRKLKAKSFLSIKSW